MPINNSVSYNNKGNIPTPPPLRTFNPSEKQTEKQQVGLTEKQYQQNMAELKSILSQVDSLMNDGKNSPETVAKCQTLMGYAAAINLPQSRKNQLIGQFPPRVQQMYKQVAKSSEAKTAQRGAMQQAMEVAMAQKHNDIFVQNFNQQFMAGNFSVLQGQPPEVWNSCLLNSSINDANSLNVALQNGWDINAKHKNPDGTESTYVEYQGAQIDKGIERSNTALDRIEALLTKSPRSKEEEEELERRQREQAEAAQQVAQGAKMSAEALKTGKLSPEERLKAEENLRQAAECAKKLRERAKKLEEQLENTTDPHERKALQQQINQLNGEAERIERYVKVSGIDLNNAEQVQEIFEEEKPNNPKPKPNQGVNEGNPIYDDRVLTQPTDYNGRLNNLNQHQANETVARERQVAQRDLNEMAHLEKPIEDGARMSEEVPGRQTSAPQTHLTFLYEFQSGSQNTRLAENSKNQNNIEVNNLRTELNTNEDIAKERLVAQRDLNAIARSEKPIEDGDRISEEVLGRQTSAPQTHLTFLDEFQSGSQNARLAENSKNQNNIDETTQINQAINFGKLNSEEMAIAQEQLRKIEEYEKEQQRIAQEFREQIDNETDPHTRLSLLAQVKMYETRATKIESNLTNSEYDVNPIISRNITPEGINNLDEKHKDLIMIDRFERPSTREINTTIASTKNSATLSNQENDLSALSNSHRDLSSNKTQTSVSDDFMSMINTISTPQQNTSMSHTKSNSSPSISAPTLPHIAQATQPSQTSKQSNHTSLDLNTTITPTQSTSGLSNTIKTVANASIVADVSEFNTENNVKPLDTSRNI